MTPEEIDDIYDAEIRHLRNRAETAEAALAEQQARIARLEAQRDLLKRRVWALRPPLKLAIKRLTELEPQYREHHEGGEILRAIRIGEEAIEQTSGPSAILAETAEVAP